MYFIHSISDQAFDGWILSIFALCDSFFLRAVKVKLRYQRQKITDTTAIASLHWKCERLYSRATVPYNLAN